jgi:plasmid stabilization system protein ParE
VRLRYTRHALVGLDQARAYIAARNPQAAAAIAARICEAIDGLRLFPERGRPGRVAGTRELVIPATPFVVAYRIGNGQIEILAIMHGARRWPGSF